ncbi:helix-turn-helix transcriptional regulator [Bacteriovorax sp. PP10]|uniref:Helix-turn-helix transcriptional regulator n=1 Tax=Bacteriovorax antarcticus TaxID=3088717 RepID=A0ABU5VXR4_9BACT|nr:helix-turn-helix transcriptional regulator [Bacteriovorax sp. PP10]MEA9356415.1 helix-turn-helix transcriptional regulator [Bacteriovorax sp. PP10]
MNTKSTTRFGIKNFEAKFGKLTIARMLEAHRLADEISLKDMAKKLGMSPSSLCDLEKGRRIPTPKRAAALAKKLGVSEKFWIQTSLQDQLDKQGFDLKVSVA